MRKALIILVALATSAALTLPQGVMARETVEEELPLARDGQVHVDLINGSLTLTGRSAEGVSMTAKVKGGLETFEYESDGHRAKFKQEPPKFKRRWDGDVDLTLHVPEGVEVIIEGVNMGVNASQLTGRFDANLVNGDIELGPGTQTVQVETVNGRILVSGVSDGVDVQTVNGRVELEDVNGPVNAETVNGSIRVDGGNISEARITTLNGDIDWEAVPEDAAVVRCETHGGSILVRIPEGLHAEVEADTFNGSIRADVKAETIKRGRRDLAIEIGSGSNPVTFRLSSFNGSIDVEAMD